MSSPAPIVGREREIELLQSALAEALDGHGRLVLVSGEAGVGKSTLTAALADEATGKGVAVAVARAPETAGAPPYWLWTQTLRAMAAASSEGQRSETPRARILALILPELSRGGDDPPSIPADADDAERFRLADEIASRLVDGAQEGGLLIVLDDVHAADASSLEVLTHVSSRIAASRLLVLAAHRDTADDVGPVLQSVLAQVSRHDSTLRVPLSGFDVDAVHTQLALVLGEAVDRELSARVHARTGGNPFFTAEVGRMIVHGGLDAAVAATAVPARLRDVITWRVDRLPQRTRDALDVAAVIGQDVPLDLLAAACDTDAVSVLAALEPAVRAGLMRRRADPNRVSFVHGLVVQTVSETLSLARAAALHGDVAAAIEATRSTTLEDWLPALARLWSAAAPTPQSAQRTVEMARRAAEQADRRLAFRDALAMWRLSIDAAVRARVGAGGRAELRLGLARSLFKSGDVGAALDACLAAAGDADTEGRADLAVAAALVVEGVSEPPYAPMLIGLAEAALCRVPSDDLATRARLHAQVGQLLHHVVPESEALDRERTETALAVRLAEQSQDALALQAALRAQQLTLGGPDGAEARLDIAARMLRIAGDTGDAWPALWARLWCFDALVQLGRLTEADAELAEVEPVVDRLRWPVAHWHLLRSRAAVLQARGRFEEALDLAERGVGEVSGSGLERAITFHAAFLEGHAEVVGELPGAGPRLRRLREAAAQDRGALLWAATSLLRQGGIEEARSLHARLPPLDQWYPPRYVQLMGLRLRLEIALGLELRDEVARLSARLEPIARWHVTQGSAVFITFGSGLLCTGRAAMYLGDLDRAVSDLSSAADDNTRCGAVTMSVVARQQLAEALVRRQGGTDLDRARRTATDVLKDAERLGMRPYAARASELLRGLPRRRLRSEELTPREHDVAGLVAQGLTNRQLAVRLGISERTVENHLDHIFSKLEVSNRAQVAAWVAAGEGSLSQH